MKWSNLFGRSVRSKCEKERHSSFRTVVDAPREEQIVSLYQVFEESNGKVSRNHLNELLILLREDLQSKPANPMKSLQTDEEIRTQTMECFEYYHNPIDGLDLLQIIDYFLGSDDALRSEVKARWTARKARRKKKSSPAKIRLKNRSSKSQPVR